MADARGRRTAQGRGKARFSKSSPEVGDVVASLHLAEVAHDRVQTVDCRRPRPSCGQNVGKLRSCVLYLQPSAAIESNPGQAHGVVKVRVRFMARFLARTEVGSKSGLNTGINVSPVECSAKPGGVIVRCTLRLQVTLQLNVQRAERMRMSHAAHHSLCRPRARCCQGRRCRRAGTLPAGRTGSAARTTTGTASSPGRPEGTCARAGLQVRAYQP